MLSGSDMLSWVRDSFVVFRPPFRRRYKYSAVTMTQNVHNNANGSPIDTINEVLSWSGEREEN